MSIAKKDVKDDGGLLYQQLRKLINIIVSLETLGKEHRS